MSVGLLAQYLLVALAVLASAAVVMRKQFPDATRRLRIVLALPLLREGRPAWMKSLGKIVAPAVKAGGPDCAGCDNCD